MGGWMRGVLEAIEAREGAELDRLLAEGSRESLAREDALRVRPLPLALDIGWKEGAIALLKAGADPNWTDRPEGSKNREGRAPIALAFARGLDDVALRMLDAKPKPALLALAERDWVWALSERTKKSGRFLEGLKSLRALAGEVKYPWSWGDIHDATDLARGWAAREPESLGELQDWLLDGLREKFGSQGISETGEDALRMGQQKGFTMFFGARQLILCLDGEADWPGGALPREAAEILIERGEGAHAVDLLALSLLKGKEATAREIEGRLRDAGEGELAVRALGRAARGFFGEEADFGARELRAQREAARRILGWSGEAPSETLARRSFEAGLLGCALEIERQGAFGWEGIFRDAMALAVRAQAKAPGGDLARQLGESLEIIASEAREPMGPHAIALAKIAFGEDGLEAFVSRSEKRRLGREPAAAARPGQKGPRSL